MHPARAAQGGGYVPSRAGCNGSPKPPKSVPEVIEHGVTGFIVDGEEDAVRAVREVSRLDRRAIRARFEERFTAVRMAREYEARYRELVMEAEAEARVLEKASAK